MIYGLKYLNITILKPKIIQCQLIKKCISIFGKCCLKIIFTITNFLYLTKYLVYTLLKQTNTNSKYNYVDALINTKNSQEMIIKYKFETTNQSNKNRKTLKEIINVVTGIIPIGKETDFICKDT